MTKNLLEADSIYLEFGTRNILSDVYVRTETGKVTGFLGRNGCGKSSLMRIIFGSLRGNFQSVRINGQYKHSMLASPGAIRYLPQKAFLPKHLKIEQVCDLYQVSLNGIIEEFPIFDKHRNQKVGALSGGEIRLFETMVILMSAVAFVILDEPFSHIMPLHVETLKEVIAKEKLNKGIIITDHLYRHITDMSDELYLIREGKTFKINSHDDLIRYGYLLE